MTSVPVGLCLFVLMRGGGGGAGGDLGRRWPLRWSSLWFRSSSSAGGSDCGFPYYANSDAGSSSAGSAGNGGRSFSDAGSFYGRNGGVGSSAVADQITVISAIDCAGFDLARVSTPLVLRK